MWFVSSTCSSQFWWTFIKKTLVFINKKLFRRFRCKFYHTIVCLYVFSYYAYAVWGHVSNAMTSNKYRLFNSQLIQQAIRKINWHLIIKFYDTFSIFISRLSSWLTHFVWLVDYLIGWLFDWLIVWLVD